MAALYTVNFSTTVSRINPVTNVRKGAELSERSLACILKPRRINAAIDIVHECSTATIVKSLVVVDVASAVTYDIGAVGAVVLIIRKVLVAKRRQVLIHVPT